MKKYENDILKIIRENEEHIWKLTRQEKFITGKYDKKKCSCCNRLVKKNMYFCDLITVKQTDVIEMRRYTICSRCFDMFYTDCFISIIRNHRSE